MRKNRTKEGDNSLDDQYAINAAKTKLRESYNNGDVEQILSMFSDSFTDISEVQPNFYGADAKAVLRARLEKLFREYQVELTPIIGDIIVVGEMAIEYGWHVMALRPKSGGPTEVKRTRYVEAWRRGLNLAWQIVLFIDNTDRKPELVDDVLLELSGVPATGKAGQIRPRR
jgi:ketosteroid isomerase-like protein